MDSAPGAGAIFLSSILRSNAGGEARARLNWSREQLAETSRVSLRTIIIIDFERGAREPRFITLDAIRHALESAGVELTNGDEPGIKLRKALSV